MNSVSSADHVLHLKLYSIIRLKAKLRAHQPRSFAIQPLASQWSRLAQAATNASYIYQGLRIHGRCQAGLRRGTITWRRFTLPAWLLRWIHRPDQGMSQPPAVLSADAAGTGGAGAGWPGPERSPDRQQPRAQPRNGSQLREDRTAQAGQQQPTGGGGLVLAATSWRVIPPPFEGGDQPNGSP